MLPYPQYTQSFGQALQSLPSSSFATSMIQRSLSSSLSGWATTSIGVSLVQANGAPAFQFVNTDGQYSIYAYRCIDLSAAPVGSLNISCSAKGANIVAGSVSWMRFALAGKFYDANNNLLLAGADLPFDLGTYNWKPYSASYPLPAGTDHYCAGIGISQTSTGTGWAQNLQINSVVPASTWFTRAFQQATVFVNPTNSAVSTGVETQPTLQPDTGVILNN